MSITIHSKESSNKSGVKDTYTSELLRYTIPTELLDDRTLQIYAKRGKMISTLITNRNETGDIKLSKPPNTNLFDFHRSNQGVLIQKQQCICYYMFESLFAYIHVTGSSDEAVTKSFQKNVKDYSNKMSHSQSHILLIVVKNMFAQARKSGNLYQQLLEALEIKLLSFVSTTTKQSDYKISAYNTFTLLLSEVDNAVLVELLSRVGRKLDPSVSYRLFPVLILNPDEGIKSATVIDLFEEALYQCNLEHASR